MSTDYDNELTNIAALHAHQRDILRRAGVAPTAVALWERHPTTLKGNEKDAPPGTTVPGVTVVAAPDLAETADPQEALTP